ncbi:MAG: hypothetical protein K8R25_06545 [Methanosarcinales archaeon]|nr:hypothetical protein [Methanosarcinales archaeon]
MTETLEKIITKGFNTWIKNLNICIPLVINYVVMLLIKVFVIVIVFVGILGISIFDEMLSTSNEELIEVILSSANENFVFIAILALLCVIITMLASSYFSAGAIGMCQSAISRGDTTIGDMISAGNKSFIHVFLADVLILLMILAGIVFLVPGGLLMGNNIDTTGAGQFGLGIILFILGLLIWVIYLIILSVFLSMVLYAIVVERIGALEGIYKGYEFFMDNKLSVIVIWLISTTIYIIIGSISIVVGQILALTGFIGLNTIWSLGSQLIIIITIQPLMMVWWTRLYMVKTGKSPYVDDLLSDPW